MGVCDRYPSFFYESCGLRVAFFRIQPRRNKGYAVAAYQVDKDEVDGYVGGFVATKVETLDVDTITAVLFESKKEAKEFYEELGGEDSKWLQEGKWVFMGTEDAIEDFKD